jgi:sugar O-acyltransferase (sialic acid O-acetyltransferase NeuD family)
MAEIVIFGTGKFAELAHFYFSNDSEHRVVAFTSDPTYCTEETFLGLPLIPFDEVESLFPPNKFQMFVAIGYKKINAIRADRFDRAKEKGYHCVSYFSSKATHWGETEIGENCFILENQVIQPFVKIGDNVVIWSGNHFGHNVEIGNHVWLSSHIVLSGGVVIDPYCFVGVNATFRDQVHIGEKSIIGAGALILNNVATQSVFVAKQTDLYRLNSEQFERMMDISR